VTLHVTLMVWKRRSHPTIPLGSGGSSRRAADLRKKCKAKDSAKLVLRFGFGYDISQHSHFRTVSFRFNVF